MRKGLPNPLMEGSLQVDWQHVFTPKVSVVSDCPSFPTLSLRQFHVIQSSHTGYCQYCHLSPVKQCHSLKKCSIINKGILEILYKLGAKGNWPNLPHLETTLFRACTTYSIHKSTIYQSYSSTHTQIRTYTKYDNNTAVCKRRLMDT
jgi:hypothetical protein